MPHKTLPPGKGRLPGVKNRSTIERELLGRTGLAAAIAAKTTPLEIILKRMLDPSSVKLASYKAAVAAAPYVHPKLSAVAFKRMDAPEVINLKGATAEELAVIARLIARGPVPAPVEVVEGALIEGVAEEAIDE